MKKSCHQKKNYSYPFFIFYIFCFLTIFYKELCPSVDLTHQLRAITPSTTLPESFTITQAISFAQNFFIASQEPNSLYHLARVTTHQDQSFVFPLAQNTDIQNGNEIKRLALFNNRFPVIATAIGSGADASKNSIKLVLADGATIIKNSDQLRGPDNTELQDISPAALACTDKNIFVLAGQDSTKMGLIQLQKNSAQSALVVIDPATGSPGGGGSAAYGIQANITTGSAKNLKLSQEDITFNYEDASMYWDDHLQRLFIGLKELKPKNAQAAADALTTLCAVGRIKDNTLILEPIVSLNQFSLLKPVDNTQNTIIGFSRKSGNSTQPYGSILKLGVMHTSTGRSYLIINGGIVSDETQKDTLGVQLRALPLVPRNKQAAQKSTLLEENYEKSIGLCSGKKNYAQKALITDNPLLTSDDYATVIGASPLYLDHSETSEATISDMQIIGDTVYISLNNDRSASTPQEQGIFYSSALFNADGDIVSWTPWERALGRIEKVNFFSVDPYSQRMTYVTDKQATGSLIKTTVWGLGDFLTKDKGGIHDGHPLPQALLDESFGPVYALSSFDDETPGFFTAESGWPGFSLLVATGNKKVALIEAGLLSINQEEIFQPTEAFYTPKTSDFPLDWRIFIKNAPEVGKITEVELSRIIPADGTFGTNALTGWLFVGGTEGIAVLARAGGEGWDAAEGLSFLGIDTPEFPDLFPGGRNWLFYPLKGPDGETFSNCRALLSTGTFLYILTDKKLWRIKMAFQGFGKDKKLVPENNLRLIAQAQDQKFLSTSINSCSFTDLLVTNRTKDNGQLLLATTNGLFELTTALSDRYDNSPVLNWNKILDKECLALSLKKEVRGENFGSYDPNKNGNLVYGNLIVTARDKDSADKKINAVGLYRFALTHDNQAKKSVCTPFKEAYFTNNTLDEISRTPSWITLGTATADDAQRLFNKTNALFSSRIPSALPIFPPPGWSLQAGQPNSALLITQQLSSFYNRFQPVEYDNASGALYGYGQMGLYVLE